jgi:hypothetical protein
MADENIFDKAEGLARRVFERLGSRVDEKISSNKEAVFSQREMSDLIAKLERAIDTNLKADAKGTKRIAPHCLRVLIPYERAPHLNLKYAESLVDELKATAFEYITNRRYETEGRVRVVLVRDFFEKVVTVKPGFDEKDLQAKVNDLLAPRGETHPGVEARNKESGICQVHLKTADGQSIRLELKANAAPASIGRAAGNRIRLDDTSISRQHCSITLRKDGAIIIADLESANGTAVNNRALNPDEVSELKRGDEIRIGDIELTVVEIT